MKSQLVLVGLLVAFLSGVGRTQEKKKPEKKVDPRIAVVLPLGVAVGQTSKVTIRGIKLEDAKEVRIGDGKGSAKILSKGKANVPDKNPDQVGDTQVVAEITLDAKLPAGNVEIVVATPDGETKPHRILVDSPGAVVKEKEPNEGFLQPQAITLPFVLEGTIERQRDVDVFRFEGKAGQKVVFEVLASRHGSPLDSILTLYSAAGTQLATSDDLKDTVDSRLEFTLPATGVYHLALMDAHDAGGPIHVYRLLGR